jgi:hypothetical protein
MKKETLEEVIEIRYKHYSDSEKLKKAAFFGAKWQQEQDNKELAMWKLAVERQEARCKALHGVISDLQERMYSEKEVLEILKDFRDNIPNDVYVVDWFEQNKKK